MKGNLENLTYEKIIADFKEAILKVGSWAEIQQLKSQAIDKIYQVKASIDQPVRDAIYLSVAAIEKIAVRHSEQPARFKIERQQFQNLLKKHIDSLQSQAETQEPSVLLGRIASAFINAESREEEYFYVKDSNLSVDMFVNSSVFKKTVTRLFNEYCSAAKIGTLNEFLEVIDSIKSDLQNVLKNHVMYLAANKIIDSLKQAYVCNSDKLFNELFQIKSFKKYPEPQMYFENQPIQIDEKSVEIDEKPDSVYFGEQETQEEEPKTIKVSVKTLEKGIRSSLFTLVTALQNVKDETQVRKLAAVAKVTIYENVSKKYNGATPAYTTLINKEVEKYKDRIDKLVAAKIESIRKLKLSEQKKTASIGLVGVFAAAIHGIYVWFKSDSKPVPVQQPNIKAPKVSDALSLAVERNRMGDVIRLLKTMDINTKDTRGMTALHWAVQHQNKDMVELLLARGANRSIRDRDDHTPRELHNFTSGHRKHNSEIGLLLDSPVNAQAVDRRSAKPKIQNSSLLRQARSNTAPCGGRIDVKAYPHLGLLGGKARLEPVKLDKLDSSSVPCVGR